MPVLVCPSPRAQPDPLMSISLNFELNDRDLEHFHAAMIAAKKAAEHKSPEEIIECAGKLLAAVQAPTCTPA